jgi:hypothetical protein
MAICFFAMIYTDVNNLTNDRIDFLIFLNKRPWNGQRSNGVVTNASVICSGATEFFVAMWTARIPPPLGQIKVSY